MLDCEWWEEVVEFPTWQKGENSLNRERISDRLIAEGWKGQEWRGVQVVDRPVRMALDRFACGMHRYRCVLQVDRSSTLKYVSNGVFLSRS